MIHAYHTHTYIFDKCTSIDDLYIYMSWFSYISLLFFLNTGAMFTLFHFSGTLISKFSKKTTETASKFFTDVDVIFNHLERTIHTSMHISIWHLFKWHIRIILWIFKQICLNEWHTLIRIQIMPCNCHYFRLLVHHPTT